MRSLIYHDPLLFTNFLAQAVAPVTSAYGKAGIRNPEPQQETETEPELKLRPG